MTGERWMDEWIDGWIDRWRPQKLVDPISTHPRILSRWQVGGVQQGHREAISQKKKKKSNLPRQATFTITHR